MQQSVFQRETRTTRIEENNTTELKQRGYQDVMFGGAFGLFGVATRAGLGTKFGPGNHRTNRRRGGVIAIVDGGGG